MIPYDIDPSLHTGEPVPAMLDDGFSAPPQREPIPASTVEADDGAEPAMARQSSR